MFERAKRFLNSDRCIETFDLIEYNGDSKSETRIFSLNTERKGFAVTFELMMTMVMMVSVIITTLYFANIYQTQRYFADITASTCTMASRYGGNASEAYKVQVGNGGSIEENANAQIQAINDNGNMFTEGLDATIEVSDYPNDSGNIGVTLTYNLGDYGFFDLPRVVGLVDYRYTQAFQVPSIISVGRLTGMPGAGII